MNVDGVVTKEGLRLIGEAVRVPNDDLFQEGDSYRCLADVGGSLCAVIVRIKT